MATKSSISMSSLEVQIVGPLKINGPRLGSGARVAIHYRPIYSSTINGPRLGFGARVAIRYRPIYSSDLNYPMFHCESVHIY